MLIREAAPEEMAEVGDIRVAAYVAGGSLSAGSRYAATLRELGADGKDLVLVAVIPEDDGMSEWVIGTIMLQRWPNTGQVVGGPDEAEVRALAVRPEAQRGGVGAELLGRLIERANETGIGQLVLCTKPEMNAAHRLYERAGFIRRPERDWAPVPDMTLLVYDLRLEGS
jgi:ribosomal protein S18 acetylase RimI-like enzyme